MFHPSLAHAPPNIWTPAPASDHGPEAPAGVDIVNENLVKAGIPVRPSDGVMARVFEHYAEPTCGNVPDTVKLLQSNNPFVDLIPGARRRLESHVYLDHAEHLRDHAFNKDLDRCLDVSERNADRGCARKMLPNGASVPRMGDEECHLSWKEGRADVKIGNTQGYTSTDTHSDALTIQGG